MFNLALSPTLTVSDGGLKTKYIESFFTVVENGLANSIFNTTIFE
ncbi:MAG: hypothetical protein CM1200mP33_0750 [Chloroflexota bacterium]|nr:MAG: hypothetical protein CM1200mP33_0750 [Chloroflexota bacterium]